MKKITSLFMMAFLLVGTFGIVAAEELDEGNSSDIDFNGFIPKPEKVGFFSNQMFKLGLAFTPNKEKKIEKVLNMAERRLAEAELLAEEDPEAYAAAQERYDELVARAEEILSDIESENGDENTSVEYIEKVARIQNKFERHRDHSDEIYARALERFANNNASDEKIARFEMFHERALNRSDRMEKRILEKRENAVLKHKALSEMSDDELEDLLERIEEGEGLTKAREKRMEHIENRMQKFEDIGARRIERVRERLEDANVSEELKERLRERLVNVEGRVEEFGERAQERLEEQKELAERRTENIRNAIEDELNNRDEGSDEESNESLNDGSSEESENDSDDSLNESVSGLAN
jgi:hypothetical protein